MLQQLLQVDDSPGVLTASTNASCPVLHRDKVDESAMPVGVSRWCGANGPHTQLTRLTPVDRIPYSMTTWYMDMATWTWTWFQEIGGSNSRTVGTDKSGAAGTNNHSPLSAVLFPDSSLV